jgi:glycosyltransferase involved in cell wall biosynthesis
MKAETPVVEISFPGNPGPAGLVAAPEITVVLSTYARAETLKKTLRCLGEQDLPPGTFDLVVVDDGSPDNTHQVAESILPTLPFPSRFRRHPNRGPGYTQNRGIEMATAPVVLLMADDIFLEPGAVRAHLEEHRRRPERTMAVLGKVLQDPDLKGAVFLEKWDPFRFGEIEDLTELPPYRFWAMNISAKREFLVENGMFLEHHGRGGVSALEDLELGVRLHGKGLRLFYAKRALGYHHHVVTLDQAIRRWYERGLNYGEFRRYARMPELTVWFHILDRHTFREYARVLRGPNWFLGREKSLAWHLVREGVRRATFNALTTRLAWRPLFDLAERVRLVGRFVTPKMYRTFLYWHFLRGVRDARRIYGD